MSPEAVTTAGLSGRLTVDGCLRAAQDTVCTCLRCERRTAAEQRQSTVLMARWRSRLQSTSVPPRCGVGHLHTAPITSHYVRSGCLSGIDPPAAAAVTASGRSVSRLPEITLPKRPAAAAYNRAGRENFMNGSPVVNSMNIRSANPGVWRGSGGPAGRRAGPGYGRPMFADGPGRAAARRVRSTWRNGSPGAAGRTGVRDSRSQFQPVGGEDLCWTTPWAGPGGLAKAGVFRFYSPGWPILPPINSPLGEE